MVIEIRNTTLSLGSGLSNQTFDLGGVVYQRGPTLGDTAVISLNGTNNILRNFTIDDSNLSGVSGTCVLNGTDNRIEDATLNNCERYGFIFGYSALRCTYRRITITKCQHGISGSSGVVGDWRYPQTDCIIEDCNIKGMIIDGIKLKQMVRTIVRRNIIDVYPFYPGYNSGTTTYSKSGIYFAATDTASKDCIVEDNVIFQSAPTPSGLSSNRAILINPDQLTVPTVVSSGNILRRNQISDVYTGALIRGSNYRFENNLMTRVTAPYTESTLSGYPAPANNVIITAKTIELWKSGSTYYGTGVASSTNFVTVWDAVHALLAPGDTVHFAGNTDFFSPSRLNLSKNDITILGDTGARIRMALSTTADLLFRGTGQRNTIRGITFSGLGADNKPAIGTNYDLVAFYQTDSLLIENCVFEYFHQYLLELWECTNFLVRNNTFRYGQNGVATTGQPGRPWNTGVIELNTIHDCSQHGVKLRESDGVIVRNNNIELAYNYWRAFDHKTNPGTDGRGVIGDANGATGVYYGRNDAPSINCDVYENNIKDSSGHTPTALSNATYSVGLADGSSWGTPDAVATPKSENNAFHNNIITGPYYGLVRGTDTTYQGVVVDSSNTLTGCHISNSGITILGAPLTLQDVINNTPAGGTVIIPAGAYPQAAQLTASKALTLDIDPEALVSANYDSATYLALFSGTAATRLPNFAILGGVFDAALRTAGIRIKWANNITLDGVTVKNVKAVSKTTSGFDIGGDATSKNNGATARNLDVRNVPGSCLTFSYQDNVLVEDSYFEDFCKIYPAGGAIHTDVGCLNTTLRRLTMRGTTENDGAYLGTSGSLTSGVLCEDLDMILYSTGASGAGYAASGIKLYGSGALNRVNIDWQNSPYAVGLSLWAGIVTATDCMIKNARYGISAWAGVSTSIDLTVTRALIQGNQIGVNAEISGVKVNNSKFVGNTTDVQGTLTSHLGNLFSKLNTNLGTMRKLTFISSGTSIGLYAQSFRLATDEICYTESGSSILVQAPTVTGYTLSSIKVNGTGFTPDANNAITVTASTDAVIEAVYISSTAKIFIQLTPSGQGTVTPIPGTYQYPVNTVVNLLATPASGWAFDYWTINGVKASGSASSFVTMSSDKTLQAIFIPLSTSVDLSYSSTPVSVDATINGTTISSNSTIPCVPNTSIVIEVPRILEETTTINPPVGFGTTVPGPGVYKKLLALDITAYPTIGSELNKWTYDGADHPASNPFKISPQQYKFKHFVVNSIINTPNPLTLTMDNFKSVQSVYELIDMGIVTISGSVSAQVAADQPITIVVTKPGGTPISVPGIKTDVNRNFTATYSDVAGAYSLVASIAADAQYASASSGVVSFSISLAPRTITVTVS